MSAVSRIIGILFLVFGALTLLGFVFGGAYGGFGALGVYSSSNAISLLIVFAYFCLLPLLLGFFFILLPGYIRKHASAVSASAFD